MRLSQVLAAIAVIVALAAMPMPSRAQPCRLAACAHVFPKDAGAIDVRDYGAKGDGHSDDTAAIIAAVAASGGDTGTQVWRDRLIYFPAGTYVVSATITKRYANGLFASGMGLVGAGVDATTIKLADNARGFNDPAAPRGVIMTTSKKLDAANNRDYIHLGEGNDAYENFVEGMTVDVGHGNPGAIGIDYLANNIGAIRDVLIRAPAGSGTTGLAMVRKWPGPALVQRVTVQGFDIGVDMAGNPYGMTFSQVQLIAQTRIGFRNAGNSVAADNLVIRESGAMGIENVADTGMFVLAGGSVQSSASSVIDNAGIIVFHGVHVAPGAVPAAPASPGALSGWLQGRSAWHPDTAAWSLPIPFAPVVDAGPADRWVGVDGQPDAAPPQDATAQLQAAVNSGATTVYLRHGIFRLSAPIMIPPTLHRIMGMNATVTVVPQRPAQFGSDLGLFRIVQAGPPLLIDHLAMDMAGRGRQNGVVLAADRQLVLRDVIGSGIATLDRQAGGGEVFLEDISGGALHIAGPREVVARQLNTEGSGVRVVNDGAPLAIVGVKTEGDCTVVASRASARTEILGGLVYVVVRGPDPRIATFTTDEASFAGSFVEQVGFPDSHYRLFLSDKQGAEQRDVDAASMPSRGLGRFVPLLLAGVPSGR
jgi:hypothetical protein